MPSGHGGEASRAGDARTKPRAAALLLLVAVVALLLAGCNTVPLRTASAPATACDAALTSGTLVNNRPNGLALTAANGEGIEVLWPYGYSSRGIVGSMELLDERGQSIAREGDYVEIGGGSDGQGVFVACAGSIRVVPPPR